jgi:hypothetical protein
MEEVVTTRGSRVMFWALAAVAPMSRVAVTRDVVRLPEGFCIIGSSISGEKKFMRHGEQKAHQVCNMLFGVPNLL